MPHRLTEGLRSWWPVLALIAVFLAIVHSIRCSNLDYALASQVRSGAEPRPDLISAYLRQGANPNVRLEEASVLCWAAQHGDLEGVQLLYEAGADPDGGGLFTTHFPLEYAAQGGHAEVVDFLLRHGARVNHGMQLNSRALALAVKCGSAKSVRLLLAAGAGANSFDDEGNSAPDLAQRMGRRDLLAALRAAGGKTTEEAKRAGGRPLATSRID